MTAVLIKQPPVNYVSKGAAASKGYLLNPAADIWLLTINQAPTSGTSGDGAGWAGPGSLLIEYDSGNVFLFINTNTLASPTWTKVGTQS